MTTANVYQDIVRDFGHTDRAVELIEGRLLSARRAWEAGRTSQGVYDVACRQAARA